MREVPPAERIGLFRLKMLDWFYKYGRDYPWRHTDDSFKVLIAEIMLRRTKADQVKPVYTTLLDRYPDVKSLARASDEQLERILYPLGLKWRSPAFKLVAREIREKYNCRVPETREELISLPGVGDYVAGAVLAIAFKKPEWMVDSNIVRLFKRYFGVDTSKEGRRDKHIIEMAKTYIRGSDPRSANLALVDFSALICTPREPKHSECPLKEDCRYYLKTELENNQIEGYLSSAK
jgi:A/G-specific adenine glycosylase